MTIKKLIAWLKSRLTERSTYAGIATIAGVAGAHELGAQISQVGDAVALIAGTGLIAATTSPAPGDVVGAIGDRLNL
jgi:energy-converting hydrogenase Eha subunit B